MNPADTLSILSPHPVARVRVNVQSSKCCSLIHVCDPFFLFEQKHVFVVKGETKNKLSEKKPVTICMTMHHREGSTGVRPVAIF